MNVSDLLNHFVKVDTPEGSLEGLLKHVDYIPSHRKGNSYPEGSIILENGNRLIIVRRWISIKKT